MRILGIVNETFDADKGYGGAVKVFIELLRNNEAIVLGSRGAIDACLYGGLTRAKYVEIPSLRSAGTGVKILFNMVKSIAVASNISEGVHIVFSLSSSIIDSLPGYLIARMKHAKWVSTFYHVIPSKRSGKLSIRALFSSILQKSSLLILMKADLVITQVPTVANYLLKWHVQSRRIVMIGPGGVDEAQAMQSRTLSISYDACFLGRIHVLKGIFDLLEAWRIVCRVRPDAKLVVMGYGSERDIAVFQDKIEKYGLRDNVVFLGYVDEALKYSVLKSSKILMCPSYEDPCSIAVSEALYCGVPVVLYRDPLYGVTYQGATEVERGDIKALANSALRFLQDQNLRDTYSARAKESAQRFGWSRIAEQVINAIGDIAP